MAQSQQETRRKALRVAQIVPIALALAVFTGLAILAWSHFFAKGPGPQLHASNAEIATGQAPPTRDAYNIQDFTEPDAK